MKICQITTVHKQDDSRIFWKQCVSMAEKGHDVTLLVMNGFDDEKERVTIKGVPGKFSGRIQRIRKAPKLMLEAALEINADIYHLHDPELLMVAIKLKKRSGAIIIFDSHEDVPKQVMDKHWIPRLIRPMVSFLVKKYEKFVTSRIDGVVSVTPIICDRFRKYNAHVVMVANYPKLEEFQSHDKNTIKNENQICYIGGLFPTRGIRELVQSLDYCEAKLVIAGKFSSEAFESEIKSLPNWNKVSYLGHLDRDGVGKLLAESQIGVVTLHPTRSYLEAFPIKLFEYMSAGLPVIASDFPLWRTLVVDNECGVMVDPLDVESIGRQIGELLKNPDLSKKMGQKGRQAVLDKYTWETQAENLEKFYKDLIAK